MKNIKIILLLVFIASVFSGCKKYEEGPVLSLRTKKYRVLGYWDIEKYLVNGADSTQALKSRANCSPQVRFYKMDKGDVYCRFLCPLISAYWSFKDNKETLYIQPTYFSDSAGVAYPPISIDGSFTFWDIIRLTNKEMWLETNRAGVQHYVELRTTL